MSGEESLRLVGRADYVMQDQLFPALVEHARDIVLLMTPDGVIVFANAAAEAAYAMSRHALVGSHISELRDPSTHDDLPADIRRASGDGVLFETIHTDGRGNPFPVEVSSREVTLGGERFLLSFIRDIRGRVERREERDNLLEDLGVANRQLEGLLKIVSSTVGRLDLDGLLGGVMSALAEVMRSDAAMLFMVDGDDLVLRSYDGLDAAAAGFRMGRTDGFAGSVAAAGEPLWTPEVAADVGSQWMHTRYGFKAMYGMPLQLDGELFGVLECAWTTDRLVSEAERVMLHVAADRVMSAVAGAQRYERTARAQRLDAALHLAADRLSASHDPVVTIPAALSVAAEALRCEVAAFGTYRDGVWMAVHGIGVAPGVVLDVPGHPERSASATETVPVVCIDRTRDGGSWLASALGLEEAMVVPVVLGGEWVGATVFGRHERTEGFDDLARDFVRRLSASMSLALANAREFDAEHRIAETLQEALLRVDTASVPVPVGHLYHAATAASRVGGDFYDVFALEDGRLAVLIGDVSGKGLEAAVFTTLVKATVRAFTHEESSPAGAVSRANRVLASAARLPDFASVMLFYLDTATGEAEFCCAGHPPGLVRRAGGGVDQISCGSPVVGAFADMEYVDERVHLDAGDVVVLYTDGATDARGVDGDFFGDDRLIDAVARSTADADGVAFEVHGAIMAFSGGFTSDDIAIVTVGMPR